jgi:alpha-mannosidase
VILRLYEGAGLATETRVTLNLPGREVQAAQLCDAREQNQAALNTSSTTVRVPLKPWETATVRLRTR